MTAMTASRDGAGDDAVPAVDVDYARLMALLRSPHSASLRDRHAAAVNRVCRAHEARGGIPLRELDDMEDVVRFVYDAVADGHAEAFEQTLCALMRLYAKPFVERSASDAGRHVDAVVRALALVAECLALQGAPVSAAVAASDAIRAFASPRGDVDRAARASTEAARETRERRSLAFAAGCAPACLRSLSAADARAQGPGPNSKGPEGKDDAAVLAVSLLRALTELSRDPACAAQMASHGAFDRLTPTLGRDFRDRRVFVGAELLWNVLEAISDVGEREGETETETETETVVALPSEKFFAALADALARATRDAHGDADKDLRNELFVAARLLAERGGAWRARFRETRVVVDVAVAAATIPEWHETHASKRVHPSACASPARPRDFEMKRLAWMLVAELAADEEGAKETLGEDGGVFVAALLAHLAPLAGFPDHAGARGAAEAIARRWSDAQLFDLQTLALRSLARLAPVTMDALACAGAVETAIAAAAGDARAPIVKARKNDGRRAAALAFLERAARSSAALAERIGGSAVAVEAALCVLDPGRLFAEDAEDAEDEDTFRGGRVTLAPGAAASEKSNKKSSAVADDPASLAACSLLAALCDGDARNFRVLRRAGGVLVLLRATQSLVATDAATPIAFGAATVRAVWRCCVPDAKNRALFVAEGGVGALLDAACRCHAALRPVILSALADILENPKTHLFFHEWRSTAPRAALAPAGAQAVTLVLNLWRVEEKNADDSTSRFEIKTRLETGEPGAPGHFASLDASGSMNALPYVRVQQNRADAEARALAAAQRKGVSRHAGDETSDPPDASSDSTRARVFAVCSLLGFEHLRRTCCRADAATLAAVERYVDLREGDTWERTRRIFAEEGTFPIGPDRAAMDAALEAAAASRAALASTVSAYEREARLEALSSEAAAHDEARERWETEEYARFYRGDKAKLTMRERLTNGVKHEAMLRGSFRGLSASGRFGDEIQSWEANQKSASGGASDA
jgi:hypothetical protein